MKTQKPLDILNRLGYNIFKSIYKKGYIILVDNSNKRSYNINIDYPAYFTFALCPVEAIDQMLQSDFKYKRLKIDSIKCI